MPQNALFYGIYGDSWKSHIIRTWRTWSWVSPKCRPLSAPSLFCTLVKLARLPKMEEHQAKFRVLAVLLGGVCCYGATCTFGCRRVDTLCWRNAAWCQSHVAPTGENHLGRNQNPEQIAWNENHLFHETGLVRNLWRSTAYNWSEFKTCVMIEAI